MRSKDRIVISSHIWTTGPPDDLAEYASHRVGEVIYIGHPLNPGEIRGTFVKYFNGERMRERDIRRPKLPKTMAYFLDFMFSIVFVLSRKRSYDIFFGVDPLNAFAGLVLKKLRIVRFVIFYTIDYVPKRFENPLLNRIYHLIDFRCVNDCDATWNLSARMTEQRTKTYGNRLATGKQITVPIGIHFRRIREKASVSVDRNKLIYVGRLDRLSGVELVIQSFARLAEEFKDLKLIIVGSGESEHELHLMVKAFSLEERVEFRGVVPSHVELERIVSQCGLGFALYAPILDSFKQFADVGKPKLYMACGLPVIITNTPPIAKEIGLAEAGIIVGYNPESVIAAVKSTIQDSEKHKKYRERAITFASKFDWDYVFDEAFKKLEELGIRS